MYVAVGNQTFTLDAITASLAAASPELTALLEAHDRGRTERAFDVGGATVVVTKNDASLEIDVDLGGGFAITLLLEEGEDAVGPCVEYAGRNGDLYDVFSMHDGGTTLGVAVAKLPAAVARFADSTLSDLDDEGMDGSGRYWVAYDLTVVEGEGEAAPADADGATDAPARMRLFIWNSPYKVQYGASFAYAMAPDAESARRAIRQGGVTPYGLDHGRTAAPDNLDIDRDPDRVLDGPCGEIYEFEE